MTITRFEITRKNNNEEKLRLYYDRPMQTNDIFNSLIVKIYPAANYGKPTYYDYIWPNDIVSSNLVNGVEVYLVNSIYLGVTPTTRSAFTLTSLTALLSQRKLISSQCAQDLVMEENRRTGKTQTQQIIDKNPGIHALLPPPQAPKQNRPASTVHMQFWNDFTTAMQNYLLTFQNKDSNSGSIKKLHLNQEEENSFNDKYRDPYTKAVMDIPVIYKKKVYDLDSLLKSSINGSFSVAELQPARHIHNEIQNMLYSIVAQRANQQKPAFS